MKFIDLLHRADPVRRLADNFNAIVFGQVATPGLCCSAGSHCQKKVVDNKSVL
jgi:hypothetical protein